jgi:hypothetical protein
VPARPRCGRGPDWYGSRLQFVGEPVSEDVKIDPGYVDGDRFVALYRLEDRLVGALIMNSPSNAMELRAMVGARASWQDGIALAAEPLAPIGSARGDGQASADGRRDAWPEPAGPHPRLCGSHGR